jgi:hypothetical protein
LNSTILIRIVQLGRFAQIKLETPELQNKPMLAYRLIIGRLAEGSSTPYAIGALVPLDESDAKPKYMKARRVHAASSVVAAAP